MFEIKSHYKYYKLWFVEPSPTLNILILPFKDGDIWNISCRTRRKKDDKIFDSEDSKMFLNSKTTLKTEQEIENAVKELIAQYSQLIGKESIYVDSLELNCNGDELTQKFLDANKSWLHFQMEVKE